MQLHQTNAFESIFPKYRQLFVQGSMESNQSLQQFIRQQLPQKVQLVRCLQQTFTSFQSQYANLILKRPKQYNLVQSLVIKAGDKIDKYFGMVQMTMEKLINKNSIDNQFSFINLQQLRSNFRQKIRDMTPLIKEKYFQNFHLDRNLQEEITKRLYVLNEIYYFLKGDLSSVASKFRFKQHQILSSINNPLLSSSAPQLCLLLSLQPTLLGNINESVLKRCRPFSNKKDFFISKLKQIQSECESKVGLNLSMILQSIVTKQKYRLSRELTSSLTKQLKSLDPTLQQQNQQECKQITKEVQSLKKQWSMLKNNHFYMDIVRGNFMNKYKMQLNKLQNVYYLSNLEKYLQDVQTFTENLIRIEQRIIANRKYFMKQLGAQIQQKIINLISDYQVKSQSTTTLQEIMDIQFAALESSLYGVIKDQTAGQDHRNVSQTQTRKKRLEQSEDRRRQVQYQREQKQRIRRQQLQQKALLQKQKREQDKLKLQQKRRSQQQRMIKIKQQRQQKQRARKLQQQQKDRARKIQMDKKLQQKKYKQEQQRERMKQQVKRKQQQKRFKQSDDKQKRQKYRIEKQEQEKKKKMQIQTKRQLLQTQKAKRQQQKRQQDQKLRKKKQQKQQQQRRKKQQKQASELQQKQKSMKQIQQRQQKLRKQKQQRQARQSRQRQQRQKKQRQQRQQRQRKQLQLRSQKQLQLRSQKQIQTRQSQKRIQKQKQQREQRQQKQKRQRLDRQKSQRQQRQQQQKVQRQKRQRELKQQQQKKQRQKRQAQQQQRQRLAQLKRRQKQQAQRNQLKLKAQKQANQRKQRQANQRKQRQLKQQEQRQERERKQKQKQDRLRRQRQKRQQQQRQQEQRQQSLRKQKLTQQQKVRKQRQALQQKQLQQKQLKQQQQKRQQQLKIIRQKQQKQRQQKQQKQKKQLELLIEQQVKKPKIGDKNKPKQGSGINYGDFDDIIDDDDLQHMDKDHQQHKKHQQRNVDDDDYGDDFEPQDGGSVDDQQGGQDQQQGTQIQPKQLITQQSIKCLNQYMKGTSYSRKNKPNLQPFNNADYYTYLFQQLMYAHKLFIFDSSFSKALIDLGHELMNQDASQQDLKMSVETVREEIYKEYMTKLGVEELDLSTKMIFTFGFQNQLGLQVIEFIGEHGFFRPVLNTKLKQDQATQALFNSVLEGLLHVFEIQNQPVVQPYTLNEQSCQVLQTFDKQLPCLLTLFAMNYEKSFKQQITISQYTVQRFFYTLHILKPFYESIQQKQEQLTQFFEKTMQTYQSHAEISVNPLQIEASNPQYQSILLQHSMELKKQFLAEKRKYAVVLFQVLIQEEEQEEGRVEKITIYCSMEKTKDKPIINYYIIGKDANQQQNAATLFDIVSNGDEEFQVNVYTDFTRHNGLTQYSDWALPLWARTVVKKKMTPIQAFRAITFAMSPFYIAFKQMD